MWKIVKRAWKSVLWQGKEVKGRPPWGNDLVHSGVKEDPEKRRIFQAVGKMTWEGRKKVEVDEVESARGNMVWCEGGMMMMSWGKMILDLKGYCLHSKNIGWPSKEFKSRKMKWSDVSFEKISLASVWRTNWKWRPHLPFSIWRNTLVFGFATVTSSPSVHFFIIIVDCFEDVSPSVLSTKCMILTTHYRKMLSVFVMIWLLTWAFLPMSCWLL